MKSILDIIRDQGRSVTGVARDAGLSRFAIYDIANGTTDPSLSTVVKLARALGIKPSVLFPELGE